MSPRPRASQATAALMGVALLMGVLAARRAEAIKCPNLQLVMDRSNSMRSLIGDKSRWQIARAAVQVVLDTYAGKVPIGLTLFPKGECGVEDPLPPRLDAKTAIVGSLDALPPGGGTPTHAVVLQTAQMMALRDPQRKQYMILVTDGLPECGNDPQYTVEATVAALRSAYGQDPPIPTFVVGFGGDPGLGDGLTRMAEAGGRPAPTPEKFYRADDAQGLDLALQQIFQTVRDEFGGKLCDESCAVNGCPDSGACVRDECVKNPCAGFDCGPGLYCYTDGASPGSCRKACFMSCPAGSRCSMGACIPDPCGNVCLPGTVCNPAAHRCEPDADCKVPPGPVCEAPSQCQGGRCALDPCLFVQCPLGTQCVAWDGSCAGSGDSMEPTDRAPHGCAALPGEAAAGPAALLLLGLLLLAARVRRPATARRR